ncbi:hypothetical protein PAHAL_5G500800 [Panicum hallii]|uniref:Uncharacterized protein n=1 Tax=Panicum hallii TaxID=206008 RepID=A0A2T8IP36_9POAL|nr:hypothetical protein PAHAL_5G500800 [Panicum hallii]
MPPAATAAQLPSPSTFPHGQQSSTSALSSASQPRSSSQCPEQSQLPCLHGAPKFKGNTHPRST